MGKKLKRFCDFANVQNGTICKSVDGAGIVVGAQSFKNCYGIFQIRLYQGRASLLM